MFSRDNYLWKIQGASRASSRAACRRWLKCIHHPRTLIQRPIAGGWPPHGAIENTRSTRVPYRVALFLIIELPRFDFCRTATHDASTVYRLSVFDSSVSIRANAVLHRHASTSRIFGPIHSSAIHILVSMHLIVPCVPRKMMFHPCCRCDLGSFADVRRKWLNSFRLISRGEYSSKRYYSWYYYYIWELY